MIGSGALVIIQISHLLFAQMVLSAVMPILSLMLHKVAPYSGVSGSILFILPHTFSNKLLAHFNCAIKHKIETNKNNNTMIKIIAKSLIAISNFTFKVFGFEIPFIAKYRRDSMQKALDYIHSQRDYSNNLFGKDYTTKQAINELIVHNLYFN